MPTPVLTVVPLRAPGDGKTRLAPALDRDQRAVLAAAMLRDVVDALRGAEVTDLVVAAGGPAAVDAARSLGVEVCLDPPETRRLDDAVAAAITTARTTAITGRSGRRASTIDVLVVSADLPLLRPREVRELLTVDAEVVVAPTSGGGTGALLRRAGTTIPTAYGPDSARRHTELAQRAGRVTRSLRRPGFTHDVDTWTDLVALHDQELGSATAAVLPALLRTVTPLPGHAAGF